MTAEVIGFDDAKARRFIEKGLLLYYGDPPDSDHQRGFMCGLASVYAEGLDGKSTDDRIATVLGWAGFGDHMAQEQQQ